MGLRHAPVPAGYHTLEQVAARFTVSRNTIQKLLADCALIAEHLGGRTLIADTELKRFIHEQKAREKSGTGRVYDRTGAARDLGGVS